MASDAITDTSLGDAPEASAFLANAARERAEQARLPYKWSQTLTDVSVEVPLPEGTKARDLDVKLFKAFVSVGFKGQSPIMGGGMPHPIKVEDSTWTIESGTVLIELTKASGQQWWPHVVVTDPKIDTKAIQPENSKLSELDGETRGMVEKMMFDNQQKQMGKPTSDELKKAEMMEKFKKANPQLDFSQVKM